MKLFTFASLKKTAAILFLFTYLFTATEFSQILKLPVLWQHYNEHKQQNPDISLISFFKMHYFNGNIKDADYDRDMQLPFKTHSQLSFSVATAVPRITWEVQPPVYRDIQATIPADDNCISSNYLSAVWQPPKV